MAPPRVRDFHSRKGKETLVQKYWREYVNLNFLKSLIFDPARLPIVSCIIIVAELLINVLVIQRVPYTEIDWIAYMQECEGFLNGTTNYSLLKGDTGPLVYPAGFLYVYSGLYFLTSQGRNIRLAQYVFVAVYLLQMCLVLRLYCKSRKVPPYVLVVSAFTSYRIHSIYVLRLFNDPIAVLFAYLAINLFIDQRWTFGSVFFSLAVSVKMNILLFAPALLLFYITNLGYLRTARELLVCGGVQLLLGAPFLATYPIEYIKGSFDLGRIFEHKWTVNYRFLERGIFENKTFHLGLLSVHLILLIVFARPCYNYFQSYCRLRVLEQQLQPQIDMENKDLQKRRKGAAKAKAAQKNPTTEEKLTNQQQAFLNSYEQSLKQSASGQTKPNPITDEDESGAPSKYSVHFDQAAQLAMLPLFLANFIGVACARSLHYQFYVWYFHTLPYLAWYTEFSVSSKFLLLGAIEFCWNTYPSTNFTSALLHVCHIVLLLGIGRKLFRPKPKILKTE